MGWGNINPLISHRAWGAAPTTRLACLVSLLATVASAPGCADAFRSLPSDEEVAELAALKRSAAGMQVVTSRVPVGETRGRPVRVAVHESAASGAPADRVVVLVHGVMSDSEVWRYLRGALGTEYDMIAVDLVGCGQSDRPDPRDRGPDGYGPSALARDVLAGVRERLAERDGEAARRGAPPARVTVVGHSLGGSVVLRMLCDEQVSGEYADVLSRVDGAVLFTPADVAVDPNQPTFRAVATVTDLEVAIGRMLGVLPRRVKQGTLDSVSEPQLAVREEAERTEKILLDRPRRRAAAAMLKQAVPLRGPRRDRPDWERVEELAADYGRVTVPCLIVWGGRDEVLPVSMGYKLAQEISGARLRVVTQGMHCLPVERPRECASLVRAFIEEPRTHPGGSVLTGPAKIARLDLSNAPPFLAPAEQQPPDQTSAVANTVKPRRPVFAGAAGYVRAVAYRVPYLSLLTRLSSALR